MIRVALSWACYWLAKRVWAEPIHTSFICWSGELQGSDPRGPWEPA